LIELSHQLRNLSGDFLVKYLSVLCSQPCAYGAYQRCHIGQAVSHGDQTPNRLASSGVNFSLAINALGIGRASVNWALEAS